MLLKVFFPNPDCLCGWLLRVQTYFSIIKWDFRTIRKCILHLSLDDSPTFYIFTPQGETSVVDCILANGAFTTQSSYNPAGYSNEVLSDVGIINLKLFNIFIKTKLNHHDDHIYI